MNIRKELQTSTSTGFQLHGYNLVEKAVLHILLIMVDYVRTLRKHSTKQATDNF